MFFAYLINALFNATIFGIFIDLIGVVQEKSNSRANEIDDANECMKDQGHLPPKFIGTIRSFIKKTFEFKSLQHDQFKFMSSLREQLAVKIKIELFSVLSDES